MSSKLHIVVVPSSPLFCLEDVPQFENFSKEDSSLLFSTLYMNHIDNLNRFKSEIDKTYLFDIRDESFIPTSMVESNLCRYYRAGEKWKLIESVVNKHLGIDSTSILILFSQSIGIGPSGFQTICNLLNNDDNNFITGVTHSNKIAFFAFNYLDPKMFAGMSSTSIEMDEMYRTVNKLDNYLFELKGFYSVEKIEDFQKLYRVLSTKDSIEFCSQEIHEQFTNLFIEYKELLKS